MTSNQSSLCRFTLVFWDFDGVIKDSVDVKTSAFGELFLPHGVELAKRVREHNERNGGSRFDKVPLYLGWAGVPTSQSVVEAYCRQFSDLVLQRVIDAPWVPGAREYLKQHCEQQYFVLLTATPQQEIEHILDRLGIAGYFREVYGAPTSKSGAIAEVIGGRKLDREGALMIGDTESDLLAARDNGIAFLLRRTPVNGHLQAGDGCYQCDDFTRWTDAR